jgi:hypothetical protein
MLVGYAALTRPAQLSSDFIGTLNDSLSFYGTAACAEHMLVDYAALTRPAQLLFVILRSPDYHRDGYPV